MITIAPYTASLQTQVVELILSIQRDEFGFAVTIEDQPDLLQIPSFYQAGAGGFWVALDGTQVVGTIALRDIGRGQGALRKMFVRASHRGREHAVAGRLLDHLVDASSRAGIGEIFLGTTERFVAAHRFYEKHGFARLDASALPETFPRMAVDTRFYARTLAPAGVHGVRFGRLAPTLPVRDIACSVAFYAGTLGFEKVFENGTPVSFAILQKDGAELHLALSPDHRGSALNVAHLMVDDAAALHRHLERQRVEIVSALRDADFGLRCFVFADPDGNRIDVGEAI